MRTGARLAPAATSRHPPRVAGPASYRSGAPLAEPQLIVGGRWSEAQFAACPVIVAGVTDHPGQRRR
jgi:hypothetical protein